MTGPTVSIDPEEAGAQAQQWQAYADHLEKHGQHQQVPLDQLRGALGDVYSDFIEAKGNEYAARSAAYSRAADHARSHAKHLENTVRNLTTTDDESALGISRVLEA